MRLACRLSLSKSPIPTEIMKYPILATPGLVVNEHGFGRANSKQDEIEGWLKQALIRS